MFFFLSLSLIFYTIVSKKYRNELVRLLKHLLRIPGRIEIQYSARYQQSEVRTSKTFTDMYFSTSVENRV